MERQLSPLGRFERILLATDGSVCSADAEQLALTLVEEAGGQLVVTTVVVTNEVAESIGFDPVAAAEREGHSLLERVLADARKRGVQAEIVLRRGTEPLQEIVGVAEERRSDVIVLGRHDTIGWWRRMMGPTTVRAIGAARCSVLVVPEGASMWRNRILLATDGSRFSDAAGVAAEKLAAMCKLPVTVLSTIRPSFDAERAAEAASAARRMHEHVASKGIDVDQLVLEGDPDDLILATAKRRGADVIVMGTHGRTGLERLMVGSVTEKVVMASTIPVLVVKL